MSHLSTDRLAAIADDTPTPDEATHLAGCWDCRAEVAAYRRLARMAAMAPLPTEPLTAWSQLAPQLRAEGIIVDAARLSRPVATAAVHQAATARVITAARPRPRWQVWGVRMAAGLVLLVGGAAMGRLSAMGSFRTAGDATSVASNVPNIRSIDEALGVMTAAQQQYQTAAAFVAAQDTTSRFIGMNEASYQARLTALDEIAAATRSALYRSPQDPMINQYYLTTLGAREATLRQIGATASDSRRLERY